MKRLLFTILLSFVAIFAYSQVNYSFRGKANIYSATRGTGVDTAKWVVLAVFSDDMSYYSSDSLALGDYIYTTADFGCAALRVDTINSKTGGIFNLDVTDMNNVLTSISGVSFVFTPTPNQGYPTFAAGLPAQIQACIIADLALRVDQLSTGGSSYVDTLYNLSSPTTLTVGGINSGTTITGLTWQELMEDILVPYIPPTFATFLISGQSTSLEVGDSITGSLNFTWTFTNGANVTASTMDIADLTTPATLYTNISNTPPQSHNFTPSIRKTTATSHSWRGSATNTQSTVFNSSNFTVNWYHKRYWGWCPDSTPSDAEILAVSDELSTSRAKSAFTATVSGSDRHVFYAYPASFGDLTSLSVGGFESLPAFTKTTRAFVNDFGVIISYNIYVSNNTFSANITNIVTQ